MLGIIELCAANERSPQSPIRLKVAILDGGTGPLHAQRSNTMNVVGGKVFLVGAGPGDPGMITLRGLQCLGLADVVLYDYLVNPRVLALANPAAKSQWHRQASWSYR